MPCHSGRMHRRSFLKLGAASAALLATAGGALALLHPGLKEGRLTAEGRIVFRAIGAAILEGSLPIQGPAEAAALDGLLERVDALVGVLPVHAQGELSDLLALLSTAAGRRGLAGVTADWPTATVAEIQAGLHGMRLSALTLRQQAYHALHDIVGGAYFSDASTWSILGYPGPIRTGGTT
jgi:hypothetical protein